MNLIKKLIPNKVKDETKYFLYTLLKIPFNKFGLPVEIMQWLPSNMPINFIDIGASKGDFSNSLSKSYEIQKGILIEPIPHNLTLLNDRFNDSEKYQIFDLAISDNPGKSEFYLSAYDVLSSLYKMEKEYQTPFSISDQVKIIVNTDTLDNVVEKCSLDIIDLIKIDVQGAEHIVLNSGINTLKLTKLLYLEFSYKPMYKGSSTFFDLFGILSDNNFRMVSISTAYKLKDGEIVQGDALFINNNFL